jgi:hypothetical protein
MQIVEVTHRVRNDFHWIGQCRHCGHRERYGDGYADHYYCTQVAPGRYCPDCGMNCFGEKEEQGVAEAPGVHK